MSDPTLMAYARGLQQQMLGAMGLTAKTTCPWCNGENQHVHIVCRAVGGALTGMKAVHCEGCDAYGPSAPTAEQARDLWDGKAVPACTP